MSPRGLRLGPLLLAALAACGGPPAPDPAVPGPVAQDPAGAPAAAGPPARPPSAPRLVDTNPGAPPDAAALLQSLPPEHVESVAERPDGRFAALRQGVSVAGIPCAGGLGEGVLAGPDCWTCTPWRDVRRGPLVLRAGVPLTVHYGSGLVCRFTPDNLLGLDAELTLDGVPCTGEITLDAAGALRSCTLARAHTVGGQARAAGARVEVGGP